MTPEAPNELSGRGGIQHGDLKGATTEEMSSDAPGFDHLPPWDVALTASLAQA